MQGGVRAANRGRATCAVALIWLVATGCGGASPEPAAAASAPAESNATLALDPPAPLLAADPAIPLHEALVGAPVMPEGYAAATAPPGRVVEDRPPQPSPGDRWIAGYWWWSTPLTRYVWISGTWRHPPPNQAWTPGSWAPTGDGHYAWTPGCWAPLGLAVDTAPIGAGPPVYVAETAGAAPGDDYVWTPGYYAHAGGAYVWLAGSWGRPPSRGMGWVEPRYVRYGGRYYFHPGRWDYPPARRGSAYRPDISVRAGMRLRPDVVPIGLLTAHTNYLAFSYRAIARGKMHAPDGTAGLPEHATSP